MRSCRPVAFRWTTVPLALQQLFRNTLKSVARYLKFNVSWLVSVSIMFSWLVSVSIMFSWLVSVSIMFSSLVPSA